METGTYRAVHRGVRNMRIRYILKLMLDDIFQKKIMIILLLAMSSISSLARLRNHFDITALSRYDLASQI